MAETVSLQLPERLHRRLVNAAQATGRPLESVILRALTIGSPPDWNDAPAEYQPALAALDRLEDGALWKIARARKLAKDMMRYDQLLEANQTRTLTDDEQVELHRLRQDAEQFMLRKAHAAAILKWRGHHVSAT